jgi:hypothetical protein
MADPCNDVFGAPLLGISPNLRNTFGIGLILFAFHRNAPISKMKKRTATILWLAGLDLGGLSSHSVSRCGDALHLGEACPAVFAIDQGEECRHDATPLLIHATIVTGDRFQPSSQSRKNDFVGIEIGFVGTSPRKLAHTPVRMAPG